MNRNLNKIPCFGIALGLTMVGEPWEMIGPSLLSLVSIEKNLIFINRIYDNGNKISFNELLQM